MKAGWWLVVVFVVVLLLYFLIRWPEHVYERIRGNQTSAVLTLRDICRAEANYASIYPTVRFSSSLSGLGGAQCATPSPTAACLVDQATASGSKAGYKFVYTAVPGASGNNVSFRVSASPLKPGDTGLDYYFVDESCRIRRNSTREASSEDPVLN